MCLPGRGRPPEHSWPGPCPGMVPFTQSGRPYFTQNRPVQCRIKINMALRLAGHTGQIGRPYRPLWPATLSAFAALVGGPAQRRLGCTLSISHGRRRHARFGGRVSPERQAASTGAEGGMLGGGVNSMAGLVCGVVARGSKGYGSTHPHDGNRASPSPQRRRRTRQPGPDPPRPHDEAGQAGHWRVRAWPTG
jgi:hypothetical protein